MIRLTVLQSGTGSRQAADRRTARRRGADHEGLPLPPSGRSGSACSSVRLCSHAGLLGRTTKANRPRRA